MNRNILIEINPGLNIVGLLPVAQLSTAYSYQFTGVGGRGGYTFKTTSALPGTFTLASNGTLSGQSGDAGTWPVTITMYDNIGNHVTETFMLRVLALPLTVSGTLSPWQIGVPWSDALTIGGGIPAYVVAPLDIPTWMSASLSGSTITLSGTPTSGWTEDTIKLQVTDSDNSILIAEPSISWATLTLTGTFADGTIGTPYSSDITIAGGNGTYSLTGGDGVVSGSLPAGLSLSIVGSALRLFGTPTTESSATFIVGVDSGDGQSATSTQSTVIELPPRIVISAVGSETTYIYDPETGSVMTINSPGGVYNMARTESGIVVSSMGVHGHVGVLDMGTNSWDTINTGLFTNAVCLTPLGGDNVLLVSPGRFAYGEYDIRWAVYDAYSKTVTHNGSVLLSGRPNGNTSSINRLVITDNKVIIPAGGDRLDFPEWFVFNTANLTAHVESCQAKSRNFVNSQIEINGDMWAAGDDYISKCNKANNSWTSEVQWPSVIKDGYTLSYKMVNNNAVIGDVVFAHNMKIDISDGSSTYMPGLPTGAGAPASGALVKLSNGNIYMTARDSDGVFRLNGNENAWDKVGLLPSQIDADPIMVEI